ncbi:MAG TPA: hypothetical protein VK615_03020, partial [Candidatus Binatia bacterium]|nr:hypothetical protein [Candidatus Binatia bacterium]
MVIFSAIVCEQPAMLAGGLVATAVLITLAVRRLRGSGISRTRLGILYGLRAVAMAGLVLLLARPIWVTRERPDG